MRKILLIFIFTSICYGVPALISFNGGEMSPLMKYRLDVDKRSMGVATLENMIIKPQGMATRRPGTYFIADSNIIVSLPAAAYPLLREPNDLNSIPTQTISQSTPSFTTITTLAGLRNMVAGTNYKLGDDIDCAATSVTPFSPIEDYDSVFDGNGKTLINLNIGTKTLHTVEVAGLFGTMKKGQIYDLTLEDVTLTDSTATCSGALVGLIGYGLAGTISDNILIQDVIVNGVDIELDYTNPSDHPVAGGLIGYIYNIQDDDITIEIIDCNVVDVNIVCTNTDSDDLYGGFIGVVQAATGATGNIIRFLSCEAEGNITSSRGYAMGGFVCHAGLDDSCHEVDEIYFHSCTADVNISTDGQYIGGFCGVADDGPKFVSCSSSGDITATYIEGSPMVGGFVGYNLSMGEYEDCSSTNDITATTTDDPPVLGGFAGQIGGASAQDVNVYYCRCTGDITVDDASWGVGGFVQRANQYSVIQKSWCTGDITITDGTDAIGHGFGNLYRDDVDINDCYSWTDITAGSETGYAYSGFGSFTSDSGTGTITNIYSIGTVPSTASSYDGCIGDANSVTSAYWDTTTSGQSSSTNGTGYATAVMQTQSTYTDWDFDDIWIAPVSSSLSSAIGRLIPFEYSTTDAYILEFGNEYIRFYRDGGQILSGSDPYSIASPYTTSQLRDIHYVQSNDVMYLVHPDVEPYKLVRSAHASWTLTAVTWEDGPFLDENETTTTTLTPSDTTGSITINASTTSFFDSDQVGALYQISHIVDGNEIAGNMTSDGNSATLTVYLNQNYNWVTHTRWSGTMTLQRSYDDGTTWLDVHMIQSRNDNNANFYGTEKIADALYRLNWIEDLASRVFYELSSESTKVNGVVEITSYTDANTVDANVISDLGDTGATYMHSEGAWSDYRGWPRAICFYQNRLILGGNENQPNTIWASVSGGDYENMLTGSEDDKAIVYEVASTKQNPIVWLQDKNGILAGTTGSIIKISASDSTQAMTRSNIAAEFQSAEGSTNIQAVRAGNSVVFVGRDLRQVKAVSYSLESDSYISPDISIISEHISDPCFVEIAVQNHPDNIIWFVRGDGVLVGMTYNEQQQIAGWHRQVFDGNCVSAAVIPGTTEDELWLCIQREIESNDVYYIEQMQPHDWGTDVNDCHFVDCGLSYDSVDTNSFTGLSHLEGESVQVFGDANYYELCTVSDGNVTTTDDLGKATIGIGYTSKLITFPVEVQTGGGYSLGLKKRLPEITIGLYNSLDFEYGLSDGTMWDCNVIDHDFENTYDGSGNLFTGYIVLDMEPEYDEELDVYLRQTLPYPMGITMLSTRIELSEN